MIKARRKKKKRKSVSYSKLIFSIVTTLVICVVIFVCIMSWITKDMSVFQVLIPCVFAEFATATGFYYSKAKAENVLKIQGNASFEQLERGGEMNGK